jgi:hypothetical protein
MHSGAEIIMKCIDPMFGKIDELPGNHKVASTDFFFQAAARICRDDVSDIYVSESLDIPAVIDVGRAELVVAAVPGDENDLHIIETAGFDKDFAVGRRAWVATQISDNVRVIQSRTPYDAYFHDGLLSRFSLSGNFSRIFHEAEN